MKKLYSLMLIYAVVSVITAQPHLDLIPRPVQVQMAQGQFQLTSSTVIAASHAYRDLAEYLSQKLHSSTGFSLHAVANLKASNAIVLEVNPSLSLPEEGYTLTVNQQGAIVVGKDRGGLFNGIQTLLQLLPPQVYADTLVHGVIWQMPDVQISDYPRFRYRGMMLDVSRTFFGVSDVEKYIDWLSMHKINRFHWHLTDDQGWRIEIKHYPRLTSVGAWRGLHEALPPAYGSGDKRYGGFYTQKEIKAVVRYAALRNVEIIPEIDMPGHSRAVAVAYPQILCKLDSSALRNAALSAENWDWHDPNVWCVGNEPNYQMLKVILKEIAGLFPSKYIHIGGDEVNPYFWDHCSRCQALMKKENMNSPTELQHYFIQRVQAILHGLGKRMAGWEEVMDGGKLDTTTHVYIWHTAKKALEAVKNHYPTILALGNYFYFDMAQSVNDRGHDWAGIVPLRKVYSFNLNQLGLDSPTDLHYILGVEGALWSELLNTPYRFMEYQSYPRIAALAVVAWTPQSERNWDDFYTRLTRTHFQRMEYMNIAFRVPPPKAWYRSGYVTAQSPYRDAVIRYTTDGTIPTVRSPVYRDSIPTNAPDSLRFRTFYTASLASIAISPLRVPVGNWTIGNQTTESLKTWNLSPVFNQAGTWDIAFTPDSLSKTFSVEKVDLMENRYAVASARLLNVADGIWHYRLSAPAYDATKSYTLRAVLKGVPSTSGSVQMQRLPYLTPTTGVIVNMPLNGHNALSLTDYDFSTTVTCKPDAKAGDNLTFVFASPLVCKSITSVTGMPMLTIFPIQYGHLEVSYDGIHFENGATYRNGTATILPTHPVKAVRIVIDAPTTDPEMVIQDLRIE
ncbi:MAG: family 20 glycosylhydrolase [Microbacter sp.]